MTESISPVILTNILEESGTLGGIAALALFTFLEPQPSAVSAVPNGFVYSKSYPFLADNPTEIPLTSFLSLRSTGAAFTITLGVHKENGSYKHISLMITALGQDGNPGLEFVFGNGILKKADVVKSPEGNVIGYENADQELTIPIPAASLEFCFDITEGPSENNEEDEVDEDGVPYVVHVPEIEADNPDAPDAGDPEEEEYEFTPTGFVGSVKIHQLGGIISNAILDGIIELDFGSVIVLPWLNDTGIYIDKLMMDWSDENMGSFADTFPQIYGPEWKGFAASQLSVIIPQSFQGQENPDFWVFGATNFLWDTEGQISVKATFDYQNNEEDAQLNNFHIDFEIYENDPIRSSGLVWLNLDKALNKVTDDGVNKASSEGSEMNLNLAQETINSKPKNPKKYLLGMELKLVHFFADEKDYFMYEFNLLGLRPKEGTTVSPNFFSDETHLVLNSLLFAGAGSWMLYNGIKDNDNLQTFGGSALVTLSALEFLYPNNGPDIVDIVKELRINKIGFRLASFTYNEDKKVVFDILLDLQASVNFDNLVLAKIIEGISTLFGLGDPGPVELFGETLDKVSINGNLSVQFNNISISVLDDEIPEELNSIFGKKPLSITATEIPTIAIQENEGDNDGPKSFDIDTETRFITKNIDNKTHFGLTFGITGVTVAGVSAMAAIKGFTLFLYPKIEFVLDFEFKLPSEIIVFYPGAFLAKGRLEIDKPLPASGGSLNLISVEVGIIAQPAFDSLDPSDYDKYLDIHSYTYQGMGTIAFGDAHISNSNETVTDNYSFWYSSFFLQFSTPIPFPTPVAGVSGFGGLFGLNVSPGSLGDGAQGISNWIKSTDDFSDVLRWEDGNTRSSWHPNKSFDPAAEEFNDIYNIGLVLAMADVPTAGATMRGQGLLLIEISFDPSFLRSFSLGARLELPKIGLKALVLLVVDPHGFVMTIDFTLMLKEDSGGIYKLRFPIEFGFYKKQAWTYVGHYLDSKGGPATAEILNNLFHASFYAIYSSETLESFGLNPFKNDSRIDIPGPAFGYGLLYKLGPKQYGPSFIHLKLFAAIGINFGFHLHEERDGRSEMMAFGEGFAGGAITLKIFFIKFEVSLLAIMNFLFNSDGYRIFGELVLRFSMPWPFDDVKVGVDFIIQSNGFLPIPPVSIGAQLTGQSKIALQTYDPYAETPELLPIDSALVLQFSRKVNSELIMKPEFIPDGNGISVLTVNDHDGLDGAVFEVVETEYQKLKYELQFNHQLENIRISSPEGGIVHTMLASWGTPLLDENDTPVPNEEQNKTLYIGTLFPPDLQFDSERMGHFHAWSQQNQRKSPCEIYTPVCISAIQDIDQPVDRQLEIIEDWSIIKISSFPFPINPFQTNFINSQELVTRPGPVNRHQFLLPYMTNIANIQSKKATIGLEFEFIANLEIDLPNYPTGQESHSGQVQDSPNPIKLLSEEIDYFEIHVTAGLVDGTSISAIIRLTPKEITPLMPVEFVATFVPFVNNENAVNAIEFNEVLNEDNRVGFQLDFIAFQQAYQIKNLNVRGWRAVLKLNNNPSNRNLEIIKQALKNCKLYCNELCLYKKDLDERWFDPTNFGGDNLDELEANSIELMDAIESSHLFKSGTTYQIDYAIRTHVKVFHIKNYDEGETDKELVAEKDLITTTYDGDYPDVGRDIHPDDITKIDPFNFETESTHSQEVEPYIGFHFPAPASALLYPQQTSPTLSLKYRSLIRRIFSIHENDEDVLTPRLIKSETGEEIQFDLQGVRIRNSNGSDQYEEEALNCANAIDEMNHMDVYVLSRALETNSNYALQLFYSGQNSAIDPVQYNAPFSTSNFLNLGAHGTHFNELISNATQEGLTDGANSIQLAQNLINEALQQPETGQDVLIEKIYQQSLGIPEARYFDSSEDGAVWMVSVENEVSEFWGVIVEMQEPIFKKSGVQILGVNNLTNEEAGIYFTNDKLMVVTDNGGTRVALFKLNGNNDIVPFDDLPQSIGLTSSNQHLWEAMVNNYIELHYQMLNQAEKNMKKDEILDALSNAADANNNSSITSFDLSILKPNTP